MSDTYLIDFVITVRGPILADNPVAAYNTAMEIVKEKSFFKNFDQQDLKLLDIRLVEGDE